MLVCNDVGHDQPQYLFFSGGDDNAIAVHYVEFNSAGIPHVRLLVRHLKAHAAQISGFLWLIDSVFFFEESQIYC